MATITVLRQWQPSVHESLSPQQLREWAIWWGSPGGGSSRARQRKPLSPQQRREWVVWWGNLGGGAWGATTGVTSESTPTGSATGRRGGSGGGQQQQQRPPETLSPQQLCEWAVRWGSLGGGGFRSAEPEEALHTCTLDSCASRCFFRDSTTVTLLTVPVPVTLAEPPGGPVLARGITVLPWLAAPFGLLTGLHLPSFTKNLVASSVLRDQWVTITQPGGELVVIYTDSCTGEHLATFTRRPGSGLYTMTTELSSDTTVLATPPCHAHSHLLVSGIPMSLPPLPRSLAPPCLPCVEGQQCAAPHSSSFPPTTAPLQTLHMDVWSPAHITGQGGELYFLLVVDDYTRYTMVFPLQSKADVCGVLIRWIHAVRLQLHARFHEDLPVLRLHSDLGGEFCSRLLEHLCGAEGIVQAYTLPASPQHNRIAKHCIGLVMEVARTSMIHAAAPHFQWPLSNSTLDPMSPTRRPPSLCGGRARLVMRRLRLLLPSSPPPQFPGTPPASLPGSRTPPIAPLPPPTPAPSGVSQVDPPPLVEPLEVSSDTSGPAEGGDPTAADTVVLAALCAWWSLLVFCLDCFHRLCGPSLWTLSYGCFSVGGAVAGGSAGGGAGGAGAGGAGSPGGGAGRAGAGGSGGTGARGTGATGGTGGAAAVGADAGSPGSRRQEPLLPEWLREWAVRWGSPGSGAGHARAPGFGGAGPGGASAGVPGVGRAGGTGDGGTRAIGGTSSAGPVGANAVVSRAGGTSGADTGGTTGGTGVGGATSGAGSGGAVPTGARGSGSVTTQPQLSALHHLLSLSPVATEFPIAGTSPPLLFPPTVQSQPQLLPGSPLPAPAPHTVVTESTTEHREPASRPVTPVHSRRAVRPRPQPVPGTHIMALRPSSVPQHVVLPSPPASSFPHIPDPESDLVHTASPTLTCLLATVVTDPSFESSAASAFIAELVCAALTTLRFELECLASAAPHLASTLLCPEGDPDALNIPTPRTYAEAITGPYSSQWQIAMDVEMASWKSTGTYVDEVPPPRVNIVDGMWIFRVKQPPGSPPAFKARYVARCFSQREGVDFFQTFSPTPKMTTLWVLLRVAAQRDYELHSLDFSTAFLQGTLHEAIWTPLAALGFAPSTADPSLFLRTDTSLPPFYVLVYVDALVFASTDTEALALVKAELHERHTWNDLGELHSYLGLQITWDRARHTITLTQSHMVHQVLQRFDFSWSSPQPTPLSTGHSLSAPPSDESLEPSGPYPELVGCLMFLMTCTRPDLAYPLSLLGRYVAPGRHRKVHWEAAKSCEAEIYAGAMAAQEIRWLTYLLTDFGEWPRSPPVLYVDNKDMIALCQEQRPKHRTKHIALHYFLTLELQQRGQLRLTYMATQANTAAIFIKALRSSDHQRFCNALGLVPTLPHLLVS
ncbi:unnamed protein product [Closterium sp. NIES-53]